jgi:hypothetical protein
MDSEEHILTVTQASEFGGFDSNGSIVLNEIGATPGVVKDTYVDNVLEALEREIDLVPERQEVFEGRELSRDEQHLFRSFAEQVRFELDRRACFVGFRVPRVDPEHMGRGFRFYWNKRNSGLSGHLDYHYDDVLRFMRDGDVSAKFGEAVGRSMIDGILKALVEQVGK